MNNQMNEGLASTDAELLTDSDLDQVAGGILPAVPFAVKLGIIVVGAIVEYVVSQHV